MARESKKVYARDDTVIQCRAPKWADDALNEVAEQRGMVKKDLFGRIINWFVSLDYDLQSCVLHQVSPQTELKILEALREQARARIVGASPRQVREAAQRSAARAHRQESRGGPSSGSQQAG